jgi:molybdate-binding protein
MSEKSLQWLTVDLGGDAKWPMFLVNREGGLGTRILLDESTAPMRQPLEDFTTKDNLSFLQGATQKLGLTR